MIDILPTSITAGLTFERLVTLTCYPVNEGWALSAALRGPAVINLSAALEGTQYKFAVTAATTAAWTPGRYSYSVRVTKDADIFEVETGTLDILPDLNAQTAGYDGSTHAQRVLAAIEAVLERRASIDQERYTINNRELWRTPIPELLKLRDTYRAEVQREQRRARGGQLFGRAVRVTF